MRENRPKRKFLLEGGEMNGDAEGLKRYACHFTGFVQGRGFRYSCFVCAEKAQVTGWVMNNPDGTVSAEVQGSGVQISDFFARLKRLVRGYGASWRIDARKPVEVIGGERTFQVVR